VKAVEDGSGNDEWYLYPGWNETIDDFDGYYNAIDWLSFGTSGGAYGPTEFGLTDFVLQKSLDSFTDPGTQNFEVPILQAGCMPIGQSVNLYDKKLVSALSFGKGEKSPLSSKNFDVTADDAKKDEMWVIDTKWETPVLDFSGHFGDLASVDTNCSMPLTPDRIAELEALGTQYREVGMRARGMWMDYGVLPNNVDEGVFLEVRESFPGRKLQNKSIVDLNNNVALGVDAGTRPYLEANLRSLTDRDGRKIESLIDACGFKAGQKAVGEIADRREIYEAVVVIPFVERDGKVNFFSVDRDILDTQRKRKLQTGYAHELMNGRVVKDTSITRSLDMMDKYVLPPQFDYAHYDEVEPFVIYFTETHIDLNKQDLADIWQNVLPDAAKTTQKDEIYISHELEEYEFFHGQDLPDDIRFMTFKVKQRSVWNYYDVLPSQDPDAKFKFEVYDIKGEARDVSPKFNYNWPNDFCSLIETARVDVEFGLEGE
jgi:hypothetical protein